MKTMIYRSDCFHDCLYLQQRKKILTEERNNYFPAKALEAFIAYRLVLDLNLIMLNLSTKRVLFTYLNTNC